jgi:zinc transporter 1
MAFSKSTRILILLAIDTVFFFIELITGYTIHSLALVADAFHMLNDVLSLCVGFWAVRVANQKKSSKTYTYGWQRAETLGALVNGVFLVALCVTICLDAIERFFEPREIEKPKIMLVVGCLGLLSNILGLFLFHEHSHGHGDGGHSDGSQERAAEEGHSHSHEVRHEPGTENSGNVADALPQTRIAGYQSSQADASDTTAVDACSPLATKATPSSPTRQRKHSRSQSRVFPTADDIPVTPNAFRKSIINASRMDRVESDDDDIPEQVIEDDDMDTHTHAQDPLLQNGKKPASYGGIAKIKSIDHKDHYHAQPRDPKKSGGHSHGDLNMRGIFLHVMGDALGNIAVIATALVVWLTNWSFKQYFDPAVSLLITCIILASAIPLCKAASRILLQAVPSHIDVDHIRDDIEDLPGIVGCHHLHVWQLSDTKLVASLHVQVDFEFKGEGSARYMELAQAIRKCLHEYGIHSSTIQPEFCLDPEHDHGNDVEVQLHESSPTGSAKRSKPTSRVASKAGSVREPNCLLECGDECGTGKGCCEPGSSEGGDEHDHGH